MADVPYLPNLLTLTNPKNIADLARLSTREAGLRGLRVPATMVPAPHRTRRRGRQTTHMIGGR